MPFVAQTNLQLYNQLRREARSDDDMRLVRAAYELAVTHYSGYFGGDRKPFVAHTIGVASILASLGQPALMIAAGLLHNVYGNGDFGDGLHNAATARRRRLVRTAVGGAVEDVLYRFHTCRVRLDPDEGYRQRLARLAQLDNEVLLLDLADVVEKHVDSSVLYHGNGSWISDPIGRHDAFLVDIARRIGQPALAVMLERQFAGCRRPGASARLACSTERKYRELVVRSRAVAAFIRSCRWRAMVGTRVVRTFKPASALRDSARLNSPAPA
jgi:hypothetical protein